MVLWKDQPAVLLIGPNHNLNRLLHHLISDAWNVSREHGLGRVRHGKMKGSHWPVALTTWLYRYLSHSNPRDMVLTLANAYLKYLFLLYCRESLKMGMMYRTIRKCNTKYDIRLHRCRLIVCVLFTRSQFWPPGFVVTRVCLCVHPAICQRARPRDKSSSVQARITKLGLHFG